jgi:hypothetical protein
MKYLKIFESFDNNTDKFEIGDVVYNVPFKRLWTVVDKTENTLHTADDDGNVAEWFAKDFITEDEYLKKYVTKKYNL